MSDNANRRHTLIERAADGLAELLEQAGLLRGDLPGLVQRLGELVRKLLVLLEQPPGLLSHRIQLSLRGA